MMHSVSTRYGRKRAYKRKMDDRLQAKRRAARYLLNQRIGGYGGAELRFVDYNKSVAVPFTTASMPVDPTTALCLNAIAQGSGNSQRGGLRASIKSIEMHGVVKFPFASNQGEVRIWLVLDKQTNGAQLTGSDVFVDEANNDYTSSQFLNLENKHRFTVLATKLVTYVNQNHYYDGVSAVAAPTVHKPFVIKKTFAGKGLQTRFLGTGATIADISDNSIHVLCAGTVTASGTAKSADIRYLSRCRFFAD